MLRWIALLVWLSGCALIPQGVYDDRFDLDGDGVPWPDDCDDYDPDVSDPTTFHADADGDAYGDAAVQQQACEAPDGYVADGTDCDDDDETAFPGGVEVCDGADNDCNGTDDDVATPPTWTLDLDDDGYGRDGTEIAQCDAPSTLYAPAGGDCDDDDPFVNPGTPEVCNSFDDDCDDLIDDDDTVVGAPVWYIDGDDDQYGDDTTALSACIAPLDRVGTGGDCADDDPDVHPGAPETDCEDTTDYNCDGFSGGTDADGDTFKACEECDDGDPAVNPNADEICNGIDDDCSGTADDNAIDATPWYADGDGDLFGAGAAVDACEAPPNHVAVAGDCADGNPSVHPGADEICNDLDDDCDTDVDDDDSGLVGAPTWYVDGDTDGWGAAPVSACVQPGGTVAVGGDCGPSDPAIHPYAAETNCEDPVDYNCDGSAGHIDADGDTHEACDDCQDAVNAIHPGAPEACNDLDDDCDGVPDDNPTNPPTWYFDDDGDGFGDPHVTVAACDAPAEHVADGTDCDDTNPSVNPGAGNCGQTEVDVGDGFMLTGVAGTRFGASVAAGDADGDLVVDVVVGAPLTGPLANQGTAWLLRGPFTADRAVPAGSTAQYNGENQEDQAGGTMAVLPVTGQAYGAEVIVGAPRAGPGGSARGGLYVVHGNATGAVALGNAAAERTAESAGDLSATSLALLRDVDANGLEEILVGAPGAGGFGAAYVLRPPLGGNASLATASAKLGGETDLDEAGAAVCDAGDLSGTGTPWIAVGAPGRDAVAANAGVVYIVPGGVAGITSLSTASAVLRGTIAGEGAGRGLAPLADIDGDDDDELLVGAPGVGGGAVYLVKGPITGTVNLSGAYAILEGASGDGVGTALATADVTGDGLDDLVIGAPGADGGLGAVYVWPSPVVGGTSTLGGAPYRLTGGGGSLGAALANAGDLDGDGRDDLVVGDPDAATAWIVPGALFTN